MIVAECIDRSQLSLRQHGLFDHFADVICAHQLIHEVRKQRDADRWQHHHILEAVYECRSYDLQLYVELFN